MAAKGIYLTIGLNFVDPDRYDGWDGELNACENDARDIAEIAAGKGFTGTSLLRERATSDAVLKALHDAAASLSPGDMLVVGYSGHGGNIPDASGDDEDGLDETWCLYDRMLIDDELYAMWSHFKPGVRILVFSDSCHSGTMTRALMKHKGSAPTAEVAATEAELADPKSAPRAKSIPFKRALSLYRKQHPLYDSLQYVAGQASKAQVMASVLLISGCQDDQLSRDGPVNGAFTGRLKEVWDGGKFSGNYKEFHGKIEGPMPDSQKPNYFLVGAPNADFEAQSPFEV